MNSFLGRIYEKLKDFDYFELGNSAVLYYFLIFGILPLSFIFQIPSGLFLELMKRGFAIIHHQTFFYLIIGFLFLIAGRKFSPIRKLTARIPKILYGGWSLSRIKYVFGVVFIFGFASKLIRVLGGAYFHNNQNLKLVNNPFFGIIGYLDWLAYIAIAVAFAQYFFLRKNELPWRKWRMTAWAAFSFELFYGFFTGSKALVIYPVIIYLIIKHYTYGRSYRRVAFCFFLILLIVMPVMNIYRNNREFIYATPTQRIVGNRDNLLISPPAVSWFTLDHAIGRLGQMRVVEPIFEKTNSLLHGRSLLNFFTILGPPRFIWKDKPPAVNKSGNELGHQLGILDSGDYATSIGPTVVGDWYMNFGILGIAFGMFFMGILFRFISGYFVREGSLSGIVFYSVAWVYIIHGMEGWVAPVYAGLVKMFLIFLIIHFFLTKPSKGKGIVENGV